MGCKQMPTFVKIEEGKVDKSTFDLHVSAHKAYVRDLIAKGHKARTGYWAQMEGGMMVFEAASMQEAQAIAANDPLVKNDCVNYKLYEWRIVVE
ncbi:YciI family protein [Fischerella sp.]|uniref:YciI family protein n=1 Tax=Fischerella sp. TaxID=1191 RepID=UPI0025BAFA3B|nr:YciI family protein [Fischerella sp.]